MQSLLYTIGKMFAALADKQNLLGTFSLLVTGFVIMTNKFAFIWALKPCTRYQCHKWVCKVAIKCLCNLLFPLQNYKQFRQKVKICEMGFCNYHHFTKRCYKRICRVTNHRLWIRNNRCCFENKHNAWFCLDFRKSAWRVHGRYLRIFIRWQVMELTFQ